MIEVDGLHKRFGNIEVLKGVSLTAREGDVISLIGASGSGKSTIVRELMKRYARIEQQFIPGRKRDISSRLFREGEGSPLFVPGTYSIATGGCDTIPQGMDFIYEMVNRELDAGYDVILEGLVVSSDVTRCIDLKNRHSLLIIEITTPIEICLEGIRSRRAVKAAEKSAKKGIEVLPKEVDPKNTIAKQLQIVPQRKRFRAAGVDFRMLNREETLQAVLTHFGWTP